MFGWMDDMHSSIYYSIYLNCVSFPWFGYILCYACHDYVLNLLLDCYYIYNSRHTGCSTLRAGPSCHVLEGYIVLYVDPTKFDPDVVRDAALTAIDWAMIQGAFDQKSNVNAYSNNDNNDNDDSMTTVQVRPFPDTVHQDARASFAGHDKTLHADGDESPTSTITSSTSSNTSINSNSGSVPVIWLLVGFLALATPILALLIYTKQQASSMNQQQQRHDILPNFPLDDIDEDDEEDDEDMNDHLVFATGRRPTSVRNLHNNNINNSMGNSYTFTHSFT
jgi:hypothetical protein